MIKPSAIFRSSEEKNLVRILDRFDIRLFFRKSKNDDYFESNLMLCVRTVLVRRDALLS